jgi:hypothetical protein
MLVTPEMKKVERRLGAIADEMPPFALRSTRNCQEGVVRGTQHDESGSATVACCSHAAVSFFDQPLRVTRFKLVHAVWRRQRMDMLRGRTRYCG